MRNQSAPMLDAGLSALIADLDERGMLDDTLVLAVGEFGRSPQRGVSTSGNANQRRRPRSLAVLLHGLHGRRRHSSAASSTARPTPPARPRSRIPVHPIELLATIYHAMGINPATIVYNHLNQPRELVKAEAVTKLFA